MTQMSSSSLCQGLQSCLEPRLIESHVLRLKLAPPGSLSLSESRKKSTTCDETDMKMDKKADMGGWSFLQSLSEISHFHKTQETQAHNVYVHPTAKHSSSMLSKESLEMCTESLGCESGSDTASENIDDIALLSLESSTVSFTRHTPEATKSSVSKRTNRSGSFPPPLTSITELGGVQVWPHREDGRLILKAVATPSVQPCFQAERSNGRLTLRLFQTFGSDSDEEEEEEEAEEEEESAADDEEEEAEIEACGEEDAEAEELEGNNEIVEDEMGKRKLTRLRRRCKESGNRNKGMPNFEPCWVAM